MMKRLLITLYFAALCISGRAEAPRIINIVNFIRQTDYRVENSDSLMLATVKEQIALLDTYSFPATFLLQYDALINPQYQSLLKNSLKSYSEIGAWWEITQPHVEAAGIEWRGNHPWVSTANIAFTTGYTPEQREKLVDVYMSKFKDIFGSYPRSVGSWFIDSHTLAYMYEKYGITASCNCKDQIGTDGYTLWGGYWNQAYYPSELNAYMPAQNEWRQIPVPIFRMLGSDPIYQYDNGVGGLSQGVISLEPVYEESGADKKWVEYFLSSMVDQPCLSFGYAQAGQENSFTWEPMSAGLRMQFPIFDSLRKAGRIRMETLGESGKWFKENFKVTPTTAVVALDDVRNQGHKSIWFNSRYYRANLFWDNGSLGFRDIHMFDEFFQSKYLRSAGTGGQFLYFTLPVVDGCIWSDQTTRAKLSIVDRDSGKELKFGNPEVTENSDNLIVTCKDERGNIFTVEFTEEKININCIPNGKELRWALQLDVAPGTKLPFISFKDNRIMSNFLGFDYGIGFLDANIELSSKFDTFVFRVAPENHSLGMQWITVRIIE